MGGWRWSQLTVNRLLVSCRGDTFTLTCGSHTVIGRVCKVYTVWPSQLARLIPKPACFEAPPLTTAPLLINPLQFNISRLNLNVFNAISDPAIHWARVSFGFLFAPPAATDTSHILPCLRQMQMSVSTTFLARNSRRPLALFLQTFCLLFSTRLTQDLSRRSQHPLHYI